MSLWPLKYSASFNEAEQWRGPVRPSVSEEAAHQQEAPGNKQVGRSELGPRPGCSPRVAPFLPLFIIASQVLQELSQPKGGENYGAKCQLLTKSQHAAIDHLLVSTWRQSWSVHAFLKQPLGRSWVCKGLSCHSTCVPDPRRCCGVQHVTGKEFHCWTASTLGTEGAR